MNREEVLRQLASSSIETTLFTGIKNYIDAIESQLKEKEEEMKQLQCCGNCIDDYEVNKIHCKHEKKCRSFFFEKLEEREDFWRSKLA